MTGAGSVQGPCIGTVRDAGSAFRPRKPRPDAAHFATCALPLPTDLRAETPSRPADVPQL